MQQPKRIVGVGKGHVESRSPKQTSKHTKIKQVKSKVFKNLNQIPIELPHSIKENIPNNHPQRPHSSLLSHEHKTKAIRVESALSQYPDHRQSRDVNNRKRLSLDSTGKRYERDSLASKNSATKKMSKNTKSIEQGLKMKITQQRRKSNVSCISSMEEGRTQKKNSVKLKRPSVSNLHIPVRLKGKQNKDPKKNSSKSRSKSKNKRKKSKLHLDKSKISTVAISTHQKCFAKKKTSTSTAQIGPLPKKKKKQVRKKSKSPKPDLNQDQFSLEQYPINKYDVSYSTKKKQQEHPYRAKSKSKSRKNSQKKESRGHSLIQMDYISCINIPSNSSGLINSHNSKQSVTSKIKIVDNWQFKYGGGEQGSSSINFSEIRYYESENWTQKKQEKQFLKRNFNDEKKYRRRRYIEREIQEEYPHFQEIQLKFLASVIFIQRKWREKVLYRKVFKRIGNSDHKISQYDLQQSNSKQLNIIMNGQKLFSGKKPSSELEQQALMEKQERQVEQMLLQERQRQQRLNNNIYLDYKEMEEDQQYEEKSSSAVPSNQVMLIYQENSSDHNLSARSSKYEYLQNQIFPNMTYLNIKYEQLKSDLQHKIQKFNQLERNGVIDNRQYQKLKKQCQIQFQKECQTLKKSKKDLKKGYLRFIDTCKNIKQEGGLRRVSSESGPMACLYKKIYSFDPSNKSQSSESMKKLTQKVLIRKQFFQNQKLEASLLHPIQKTLSARQQQKSKQPFSLSARFFKKTEFGDSQNVSQKLQENRIREGFLSSLSPQPEQNIKYMPASPQLIINSLPNCKQDDILNEIIADLSHQLFAELITIDEHREHSIDIIEDEKQSQLKIRTKDFKDFQIVEESSSVQLEKGDKEEDFQIVEESKFREIFKIEGLAERNQPEINRKHRNSNTHHISPVVIEPVPFQSQQIIDYGQNLYQFLKKKQCESQLITKLNKNQGFSPRQYLKFLRDYQIIDEEYEPIISNETFVEWEDEFYSVVKPIKLNESYMKRQATTIFHRCIFECLISLLEENRPSGEKGDPFPWQNVIFFKRSLSPIDFDRIFKSCLEQLQILTFFKCGLLQEKQLILSEQDLQRLHEQNQDKIINMLQRELEASPHNWYQVQEHGLEIKLEIDCQLFEYIMLQALDELLQIL